MGTTKIHEALTTTKEGQTLSFKMIRSTEKFNFSETILNTTKKGLNRLSDYNSVFNVNKSNNQFLYASDILAITPGGDELSEIAELKNEETEGNVIIEEDKNTVKCRMEIKQCSLSFDVENSIAS